MDPTSKERREAKKSSDEKLRKLGGANLKLNEHEGE